MNQTAVRSSEQDSHAFSARAAKDLVDDLFALKPHIYWCDLLISAAITYVSLVVYLMSANFSVMQFTAFSVASIGLFRIAIFMHEIVHMRRGHMRGFKFAWNVLVGVPLLTPSLFYSSHADHHSNRHYATPADGEYLPFGQSPPGEILRFIATIPLVPVLAVARALLLVPASLLNPRLRRWLLAHASAAVISPSYKRRHVPAFADPYWLACDIACFSYAATIVALTVAGIIPLVIIGKLYVLVVTTITLNWIRTLAAHRYRNDGLEMSHNEQVEDSINIVGHPLATEILYPVGLRYHALHHLLPSLPYHALGAAHRRLVENLPADSPYHRSTYSNTLTALRELWHSAASSGEKGKAVRRFWRAA